MRKRFGRELGLDPEALLLQRQLLNAFDREGPDLAVFRNPRQQIEAAVRVHQPVRCTT